MLERLELLIGKDSVSILKTSHVVILGLGGVGGYVLESLVRSGVGKFTIVDFDKVELSNLNRQIIALRDNIGKNKTTLFYERMKNINPDVKINIIDEFISDDNIDKLFKDDIDYFIDACDTMNTKKLVIDKCINLNINFITCMGTGNRFDPSKLEITDIRNTKDDPVARIIRKYVKDMNYHDGINCLCSREVPVKVKGVSSNAFVPSSAGLMIGSYVVKELIK